jgi:hypothetical protein
MDTQFTDPATADAQRGPSPAALRRWGGTALIAALPLQVSGFLLHPAGERVEHVTASAYGPAHLVLFVSWTLVMVGLPAMYARQAGRAGRLGVAGFVLTMAAVAYHIYLTLYEAAAVPVLADHPATIGLLGPDGPLAHGAGALGPLATMLLLAFPLFGMATLRARVLPRSAGWLQVAALPASFVTMAVLAVALDGVVGTDAEGWLGGMLPISVLYWLLFTGYAAAGRGLWRSSTVAAAAGRDDADGPGTADAAGRRVAARLARRGASV